MKYILCELDDESYAHPSFSFHESFEEVQKKAIETIIDVFNYAEGYNLQLTTEDPESEKEIKDSVRISASWGEENGNSFYVTEFFPVDETKGTHLLVWHHAYEGVGFKILLQGTYEECLAERRKQMKELYEDCEAGDWGGTCILAIEQEIGNYVISAEHYGDGYLRISKSMIRYNLDGSTYFMRRGRREKLSNYIRCGR